MERTAIAQKADVSGVRPCSINVINSMTGINNVIERDGFSISPRGLIWSFGTLLRLRLALSKCIAKNTEIKNK